LAILTVTLGEMLAMPFMNSYWIARTVPGNRGRYAALYTMAWSAAQVAGPLGGSQAADRLGFDPLWWIVAGTCALAAWLFARNDAT
ncbi:MAG: hypothetical protein RJA57_100, partial [Bacteroidota bacterium]